MSTIAAYKDAYKKTGRVFIMILIMALLLISLTACNGLGSGELKVIVYKNGRTVNDVYIALYDGSNRIKYGYTLKGSVHFRGIPGGNYHLKIITPQQQKQSKKIRIQADKTEILKIRY